MKTISKIFYTLSVLSVAACIFSLFAINHGYTHLALLMPVGILGFFALGVIGMVFENKSN